MSSSRPELVVDWCSYQAAKYAVEHWHYSERMPAGKLVKVGAWENEQFVGCVLFGRGAIYRIGSPYGLKQTECIELVRIALTDHCAPVSRIASRAIEMLRQQSPGLRLIVSYADESQGHVGSIYQAMNWIYVGSTSIKPEIEILGKAIHRRSVHAKYGTYAMDWLHKYVDSAAHYTNPVTKHKYLFPLDRSMRRQIMPLAQPYPKRESCGHSSNGGAADCQSDGPGSIPGARSEVHKLTEG